MLEFFARLAAAFFGVEAVLVQYGLEDTVGAVLVGLFGTETLSGAVDAVYDRIRTRRAR